MRTKVHMAEEIHKQTSARTEVKKTVYSQRKVLILPSYAVLQKIIARLVSQHENGAATEWTHTISSCC